MTRRTAQRSRRRDGSSEFTHIALGLGISLMMVSAVVCSAALSAAFI